MSTKISFPGYLMEMAPIQENNMEMVQIQENKILEIIDEFKIILDKITTGVPKEVYQIKAGLKTIVPLIQKIMEAVELKVIITADRETIIIVGPKITMEITAEMVEIDVLVVPCELAKLLVQKFLLVLRVLVNLHVPKGANRFLKAACPKISAR